MANDPAFSPALAASGLDPIQLHIQAMNCLSRIMRELRADNPNYDFVTDQLASATDAIGTLAVIDAHLMH